MQSRRTGGLAFEEAGRGVGSTTRRGGPARIATPLPAVLLDRLLLGGHWLLDGPMGDVGSCEAELGTRAGCKV